MEQLMYRLICFWILLSAPTWAQSIQLGQPMKDSSIPAVSAPVPAKSLIKTSPKPAPQLKLKLVEFRDAKLENVFKFIQEKSGLRPPPQIKNLSTDLSMRLEDTSWDTLLKIIVE